VCATRQKQGQQCPSARANPDWTVGVRTHPHSPPDPPQYVHVYVRTADQMER